MSLPKTIYLPLDEEVTLLPRIPVEDFLESVIRPDVSLTRLTPWINAPLIKAGTFSNGYTSIYVSRKKMISYLMARMAIAIPF